MQRIRFVAIVLAVALFEVPYAGAQAQSSDSTTVNLLGIWDMTVTEGSYKDRRWDHHMMEAHLDVTEQTGGIVHATFHAKLTSDWAHDGIERVSMREVEMLGVISWSSEEVAFASHSADDAWVFHGRIVNNRTIELMAYETGEFGWVSRNIAVRR